MHCPQQKSYLISTSFEATAVNWALSSLHEGSLNITHTVPLNHFKEICIVTKMQEEYVESYFNKIIDEYMNKMVDLSQFHICLSEYD